MIIVGAKGFAKEVLEILVQNSYQEAIAFFDNVNDKLPDKLYGKFSILRNESQAMEFFDRVVNSFTLGIGESLVNIDINGPFDAGALPVDMGI